jgi:uncharacterized membrane protein YqjE
MSAWKRGLFMAYRSEEAPKDLNLAQLGLRFARETSRLVRSHLHLASVEIRNKVGRAVTYIVLLAVGALILYLFLLGALASAVIVLALFVPLWVSAIVITLVLLLGGGILTLASLSGLKKMDWRPTKTIESFRESMEWLKATGKSAR